MTSKNNFDAFYSRIESNNNNNGKNTRMNKMQSEFDQIVSARLEIDFQTVATWRIDIKRFFLFWCDFI